MDNSPCFLFKENCLSQSRRLPPLSGGESSRLEWIVGLQYVFNNYSSAGSSVVFSFGGITSEKIKNAINAATKPGTIGWLK